MPLILPLRRLKQEDCPNFEASLGYYSEYKMSLDYTARVCLKTLTKNWRETTTNRTADACDPSTLWRWRQEDHRFKPSLGNLMTQRDPVSKLKGGGHREM